MTLLGHQPGDDANHRRLGINSQLPAGLCSQTRLGAEPLQINACSPLQVAQLSRGDNPLPTGRLHVLLIDQEDSVGAGCSDPRPGDVEAAPPPHQVVEVEAMLGAADQGHASQPRRQAPQQVGLGSVGVDQMRALPPEEGYQAQEGHQVGGGINPATHVDRKEPNPTGLDIVGPGAWSADGKDLIALALEVV